MPDRFGVCARRRRQKWLASNSIRWQGDLLRNGGRSPRRQNGRFTRSHPAQDGRHGQRANDRLRGPPRRRAGGHRAACRAAVGGGLRAAVDARRESGQMAPRPHDVVLRNFRAGALRSRLSAVPTPISGALQLLLQRGWRQASAAGARPAVAPDAGRGSRLPRCTSSDHLAPLVAEPTRTPALASLLELGLQHEQQHQELILTDLKHLLSRNPLQPAYLERWPLTPVQPRRARWIGFAGGLVAVGHRGAGFCFDNEQPRHRVFLAPFELASHPVTHGEFLAFVDDGGYTAPGTVAVAGLGHRASAAVDRADCTGNGEMAAGRRSRCTAASKSTPPRR